MAAVGCYTLRERCVRGFGVKSGDLCVSKAMTAREADELLNKTCKWSGYMQFLYAFVWAIIFGLAGLYLIELGGIIFNILGYTALMMCGLSIFNIFKTMGR